jgi:hypothetical protein
MANDNGKRITAAELGRMCDHVDNKIEAIGSTKVNERGRLISELGDAVMFLEWATDSRSRAANERRLETVARGNKALLNFGA